MLAGFHLAVNNNIEFSVHVFIRCQIYGHQVRVVTVGDGVIPGCVLGVVFRVLFNIPWINDFPCGGSRASLTGVGDSEVEKHRLIADDWTNLTEWIVFTRTVAVGDHLDKYAKGTVNGEGHVGSQFRIFFARHRQLKQSNVHAVAVRWRIDFHANGDDLG